MTMTITPYIRGQVIDFTAKGLKPFTMMYAFFDGQDVSEYCKMSTDTVYSLPGDPGVMPLTTNVNGELNGQFRIPSGTFLTGTKTFVLSNNSNGDLSDSDSSAIITFTTNQSGTVEVGSVLSTQEPNITINRFQTVQDPISARQTFGLSYKDPLAQTFFVQGSPYGVVLTKIEVYFKSRPNYPAPITLQIREVIDGYPSDNILPYSTVTLHPKDVNVSEDASAPTVFVFPSPVYLKNNAEYACVLIPAGDNFDYEVWVGRLGETVVGSTEIIDLQPNIGKLFVSNNNSSWVIYEDRDIKFSVYIAEFNDTLTGTLELKNKKIDYITVPSNTVLYPGDLIIQSTGRGEVLYFNATQNQAEVLITSGYLTTATASRATPISGTWSAVTSLSTINGSGGVVDELDAGDVLINAANATIGTISSAPGSINATQIFLTANAGVVLASTTVYLQLETFAIEVENNVVHVISPALSYITNKNTSVNWDYKMYDSTGAPTSYVALPEVSSITYGERKLYSYSQENNSLSLSSSEGTLMLQAIVDSVADNVSPIIDIEKSHVVLLENYVDALTDELTETSTTSTSSTTVTGTSTLFNSEVISGSVLRDDDDKVLGVVKSVNSDTSITLHANAKIAITSETITADNIASSEDATRVGQFITRNVELANNQDADDIIVYLNADIPPNTDVRVYVKLLSSTDTSGMAGRVWTRLEKNRANSAIGFANWQYTLKKNGNDEGTAVGGLNSTNVFEYKSLTHASTYTSYKTFAVKVAMVTSNPAVVPTVFNMGVVALQA